MIRSGAFAVPRSPTTENEEMYGKILPAIVAGLLLGTCAVASAQTTTQRTAPHRYAQPRGYYMQTMPTDPYRYNPYAGTVWDGVAPYGSHGAPDPYAGTRFQGVAPY
jgi:hypothetical protein